MTPFRTGFFQFKPRFGMKDANLSLVLSVLRDVTADLIVLPELAFTGYYFQDRAEALALAEEPAVSPMVMALTALCRERHLHIVTGFAERNRDRCFNSALLIGPNGIVHTYRKLHLFNEEKRWFDPGDVPLSVVSVGDARVGIMICFDWIFPEVARVLAISGADILAHPANLVLSYSQDAMKTRCLENHLFAVTANRYGVEKRPHGTLQFTGQSQITAPRGRVLCRAPRQRAMVYVKEVDLEDARAKRITPLNDLASDRRPDYYGTLAKA